MKCLQWSSKLLPSRPSCECDPSKMEISTLYGWDKVYDINAKRIKITWKVISNHVLWACIHWLVQLLLSTLIISSYNICNGSLSSMDLHKQFSSLRWSVKSLMVCLYKDGRFLTIQHSKLFYLCSSLSFGHLIWVFIKIWSREVDRNNSTMSHLYSLSKLPPAYSGLFILIK